VAELPSGTVTFLFTDLEGSTRLWEQHPDAMRPALARHDTILRKAVAEHDGYTVKTTGDGMHAVFGTAHDAVDAAVAIQQVLAAESFDDVGSLRIRIGVHTCEAEERDGDYFGSEVNRAARLMSVAHGGQVVVSLATSALVRDVSVDLVDLGEHRLRDLTNLERVFQVTAPGLATEFPPLRSLDALPGNLPRQVTSFVGREAEIAAIVERVRTASVVTLTGVGGVGKTRLALQVAAEVLPHFRDGAWLAELAALRDPEAVPDALVAVFGLQVRPGITAMAALVEFLAGKELLLVVDNCEHLLRAVATVVDEVVRACPNVRVLATSREGLNVAGEQMVRVESLELPGEHADLDAIAQCDAVVLFVERARALKAGFALDAANAAVIAQVCRRLDGIALAIELAAARTEMLSPADIARRLDQRFRLLGGGARTAVERHQTLRAAIDWSYDLLDEREQLLLQRLSIFAGGFSLEAAEAVADGGPVDADDVFELLAALVARSLVAADTDAVETRYRLLETIRQYAQDHLDAGGDGERLRTAHAAYFADFTDAVVAGIVGPEGVVWEHRLAREGDNLRAALTWAADTGDVHVTMRLLGLWDTPNAVNDASLISASAWACDALLALPNASEHPRYPRALALTGLFAWGRGDQELARRRCEEAFAAERRLGTDPEMALRMISVNVALQEGHVEEALGHADDAVAMGRVQGAPLPLAVALAWAAMTHVLSGDPDGAALAAEEAVGLVRRLGNPHLGVNQTAFAAFALADREPERALVLAREAVALIRPDEHNQSWAVAGDVAARVGELREALVYFDRAIDALYWLAQHVTIGIVMSRVSDLVANLDPEGAAVLAGVSAARAPDFSHAPHTVAAHEIAWAEVEAILGPDRIQTLRADGMAMTDEEAVAYTHAAIARVVAALEA